MIYTSNMTDEQYFAHPAISNSDLTIARTKGIEEFYRAKIAKESESEENENFDFGSLVHCKILEPQHQQERFVVFSGNKPGHEKQYAFATDIILGMDIETAYRRNYSVKGKTMDSIRIAASELYDKICDYINCMREAETGKILISKENYDIALRCVEEYSNNPFVVNMFYGNEDVSERKNIDIYNEFGILWHDTTYGLDFKCKVDRVLVDHTKRIIFALDLKTTRKGCRNEFYKSFYEYGYHTQAAHYREGIEKHEIFAKLVSEGYQIVTYIIAMQKVAPYSCRVYKVSDNALINGYNDRNEALKLISKAYKSVDPVIEKFRADELLTEPEEL